MQYGEFNDKTKEYIITKPNTPKSWSNYLGNTTYGAIITNNAGGYSFYKSGGKGRFMRMRFNSIPLDQPGRYIYFHDTVNKDFWSASWQPVGKPLDAYKSVCHHGMGYTTIKSEYTNILSESTFYVPMGKSYEVWRIKVTNQSKTNRSLRAFSYVEYAANWNAIDDLLNIQYVQYISKMSVHNDIIDHGTNLNIPEMPEKFDEKDQGRHTFQAMCGINVIGYDTDRETFIGPYRSYANPISVESGQSSNSLGYGDNPCGSLCGEINLEPNETKEFVVIVGIGSAQKEGVEIKKNYQNIEQVNIELEALKSYWHNRVKNFEAITPDSELNSTINTWGIYNALISYAWSRSASLIYSGIDRDGLGYRDSVQDLLGVTHAIPEEVKERLELLISGQESTGGAKPVIYPVTHRPGNEKATPENEYRSDDALWLFNAIPNYVKETGNLEFYNKVIPYSDQGEDSVFSHLRKAIEFSLKRSGKHGLPTGLLADWNDCLKFGHDGESVFVAMQLRYALKEYASISKLLVNNEEQKWALNKLEDLDNNLNKHAWDGEWFLRGFRVDGLKFGSKESDEGQIYLNPQVWSIISNFANTEQANSAMQHVKDKLATEYGVKICTPSYTKSDFNIVRAQLMNPSLKENGGIFMHTQPWAVIAACMLGDGNGAYKYLRSFLPASYNKKAELREIEPYVLCQSTHAEESPKHGASRVPWLSGSATWTYYAITQHILGIRPDYHYLIIDPCIPSNWTYLDVKRRFRGMNLNIQIFNKNMSQHGIANIVINGNKLEDKNIPLELLSDNCTITVNML